MRITLARAREEAAFTLYGDVRLCITSLVKRNQNNTGEKCSFPAAVCAEGLPRAGHLILTALSRAGADLSANLSKMEDLHRGFLCSSLALCLGNVESVFYYEKLKLRRRRLYRAAENIFSCMNSAKPPRRVWGFHINLILKNY